MNVGECFEEVRNRLGEDVQNFWSDTAIYRALNQAIQRFSHEARWTWLVMACEIDVTAGTTEIQLIDDVDFTRNYNLILVPTTGDRDLVKPAKVDPHRAADLRKRYYSANSGPPQFFYHDHRVINEYDPAGFGELSDSGRTIGAAIRIIPAADQDYTAELRYYRNVRLLSVDDITDVPDCPIQYHDAIVALATGNLWLKELNGGGKAQEQFNLYNSILDQARIDQTANANDEVQVIGSTPARWVPHLADVLGPLTDDNYGSPDPFAGV
jgi:hypothetical protein